MKHIKIVAFLCVVIAPQWGISQSTEVLQEINRDIWLPFIESYNELDAEKFMAIHSEDLVRVPRDAKKIFGYEQYKKNNEEYWKRGREEGRTRDIDFAFLERIFSKTMASEIGIFQVINEKGTVKEETYYGKFHVILLKKEGKWKIRMDSDSDDGNTIDMEDFEAGYPMTAFEPFLKSAGDG